MTPTAEVLPWHWHLPRLANTVLQAALEGKGVASELNGLCQRSENECVKATGCSPSGAGPQFVPADACPAGEAYESYIASTASVPTRDNLHDAYNGLTWCALPRIKRRFNQLQAAEIAQMGVGKARGKLRDAITLLDENGALLSAPHCIWQSLAQRDWLRAFVTLRREWQSCWVLPLGHALLEQLHSPRKNITAHVLITPQLPVTEPILHGAAHGLEPRMWQMEVDRAVSGALSPNWLATKPWLPLPVMGIPGWCAENESPEFYADATVFRPFRAHQSPPCLQSGSEMNPSKDHDWFIASGS